MRKFRVPNTYVIIAAIIVVCAVLTWFVPGGQYVKADDGTLSYESVDNVPQTWQVLSAIYHGFVKQAGIIVFILVVGGAFWLLNATGAVETGIQRFIVRIGKRAGEQLFLGLGVAGCLLGVVFIVYGHVWAFVLPLIYLRLHILTYRRMVKIGSGTQLNGILGENARNMFIYGILVTIGLLISTL